MLQEARLKNVGTFDNILVHLIYSKIFPTSLTFLTFPSSNLNHEKTKSCSIFKGIYVRPKQDNFLY